jgi:hypothetical protein
MEYEDRRMARENRESFYFCSVVNASGHFGSGGSESEAAGVCMMYKIYNHHPPIRARLTLHFFIAFFYSALDRLPFC